MALWESRFGRLLCVLLLAGVGLVALTGVRVHLATHPERDRQDGFDFDSLVLAVDEVRFPAVDGIELAGWLLEGDAAFPPILLCHDLGSSKTSLVYQAIDLNGRGYTVLLFDFRGHGHSRGRGSTLGLEEKRDILVVMNNGKIAGQIVAHAHIHIVPRFKGDRLRIKWSHKKYIGKQMKEIQDKIKKFV